MQSCKWNKPPSPTYQVANAITCSQPHVGHDIFNKKDLAKHDSQSVSSYAHATRRVLTVIPRAKEACVPLGSLRAWLPQATGVRGPPPAVQLDALPHGPAARTRRPRTRETKAPIATAVLFQSNSGDGPAERRNLAQIAGTQGRPC